MGQLYARLAHQLDCTRLVAVAGRSQASTLSLAESLEVPGYADSRYGEMLEEHPHLEAIIVATSEWAHLDPVLASIHGGKHVLVEKPMATAPDEAARMLQSAEQAGVKLMVCHSLRFDPRFALMHQAVARGDIGEVLHMYGRRNSQQGAVARVLGRFPLSCWLMPHDIDMMLWTASSPVLRVRAQARCGGKTREDFILATLSFASGAVGIVECSWNTPPLGGRPQNQHFTVRGTSGVVEVLGHENGLAIYRNEGEVEYPDTIDSPVVHGQTEGSFRSLVRHFAGFVRDLWPPLLTGSDGLAAIQVASAIDRSLQEDREIIIS